MCDCHLYLAVLTEKWGPVALCETWGKRKLFIANCALHHVGSCGYTTRKPSVLHSMLPRCHPDQELKERYIVLLMVLENVLGAILYELFYSMKPKGQIFSIQVIRISDIFVSISPLHFVNRDRFRFPRTLQKWLRNNTACCCWISCKLSWLK